MRTAVVLFLRGDFAQHKLAIALAPRRAPRTVRGSSKQCFSRVPVDRCALPQLTASGA